MCEYEYSISLRVIHPTIDPEIVSKQLCMEPNRSWKVDEQRSTPKGTPLEGVYRESYWYTKLTPGGERSSAGTLLEEYLSDICSSLSKHAEFFMHVRKDGGRVVLFVQTYSSRNYGFEFSPKLMMDLANNGLTLELDIYPYPQNWG